MVIKLVRAVGPAHDVGGLPKHVNCVRQGWTIKESKSLTRNGALTPWVRGSASTTPRIFVPVAVAAGRGLPALPLPWNFVFLCSLGCLLFKFLRLRFRSLLAWVPRVRIRGNS